MNINEIKKMLLISLATFVIGFIFILNPHGLDEILSLILQDYSESANTKEKADSLVLELKQLDLRSISDIKKLATIADIPISKTPEEIMKFPRGYRIFSKISKVKRKTVDKLIQSKKCIAEIIKSSVEDISMSADIDLNTAKYIRAKLDEVSEKLIDPIFE